MKKHTFKALALISMMMVGSVMASCPTDCNTDCDTSCAPKCLTNRTFLMPRDVGTNMAMDHTTWHRTRFADYTDKKHFGARFQAIGFYKESDNRKALGKYFGYLEDDKCQVRDFISVSADNTDATFVPQTVLHDANRVEGITDPVINPLQCLIPFRPRQEAYGVKFMYHQKLNKWLDGLYFSISAPITHVQNDITSCCPSGCPTSSDCCPTDACNRCVGTGTPCKSSCNENCNTSCEVECFTLEQRKQKINEGTGKEVSFLDYLAGRVEQTQNINQQAPLCKAKVDCCSDSETVFGDIRVELGYDFLFDEDYHMGVALMAVFPTSNTPTGEHLFEAVGGNGNAWAFGALFDTHYNWRMSENSALSFHFAFNYQYVFEKTQMRTLGFKNRGGTFIDFGHYILGGEQGKRGVFPLANVLTRRVEVEAGSKVDTFIALDFECHGFTFDLGYNLFYKDKEDLKLCNWTDDRYAMAAFAYNTTNDFDVFSADSARNGDVTGEDSRAIQCKDLCVDAAATPSQLTHTLFGGIGYTFQEWRVPLLIGFGASYEWADRRTALEGWSIWGKLGFAI